MCEVEPKILIFCERSALSTYDLKKKKLRSMLKNIYTNEKFTHIVYKLPSVLFNIVSAS